MAGVELMVGGWFASAVISNLVTKVRSLIGDNYDLHKDTHQLLGNLEAALPRVQAVIEVAERRPHESEGLAMWLRQLKDATYEAEDVLDDFECKVIKEKLKGRKKVSALASSTAKAVKTWIFSDADLKSLKGVVVKLEKICAGVADFIELLKLNDIDAKGKSKRIDGEAAAGPYLAGDFILFGREEERNLILDMMMDYYTNPFDNRVSSDKGLDAGRWWNFSVASLAESMKFTSQVARKMLSRSLIGGSSTVMSTSPCKSDVSKGPSHTDIRSNESSGEQTLTITERSTMQHQNLRNLGVLPIYGIGGVGKTTLAQVIYNDSTVKEHFAMRAWVSLSDSWDDGKIMHDILQCFNPQTYIHQINGLFLREQVIKEIEHNNFFIVLDDMQSESVSKWHNLQSVLSKGQFRSMVLVTTRKASTADMVGTMPSINLNVLPWDSFLPLFEYHAFRNSEIHPEKKRELQSIGKEIARKLHGLPLAGKFMGSVLRRKLDAERWRMISQRVWWKIDGGLSEIRQSLGIGYEHLDAKVKQCFAYCSTFPRNYVFEKKSLVQMWIALGFIGPNNGVWTELEHTGIDWFDELVDMSFFQSTVWKNRYTMHDLIRDLAIAISSGECYVLNDGSIAISELVRHLSIDLGDLNMHWGNYNHKMLHTIILLSGGDRSQQTCKAVNNILDKSTSLRVLDLSYIAMIFGRWLIAIGNLSHLRFLDLSFTGIIALPDSFCGLCLLQVLDLRGCWFSHLPDTFNRLINLRYLYADKSVFPLIYGIGQLSNLQELEIFRVQNKMGHKITELKELKDIGGRLHIENLNAVSNTKEVIEAKLVEKRQLNTLVYSWNPFGEEHVDDFEVLANLRPHANIEELTIEGYKGTTLPNWVVQSHEFTRLNSIHLRKCQNLQTLPPLGQLPSLKILYLDSLEKVTNIGAEFYGSSDVVFPSLEELTFSGMLCWKKWSDVDVPQFIPYLRKLQILGCFNLVEAPFHCLSSSLLELEISGCPQIFSKGSGHLETMTALTHLSIAHIHGEISLPCNCLKMLESLDITACDKLHFEGELGSLIKLKKLGIHNCKEISSGPNCERQHEEEDLQLHEDRILMSLTTLSINYISKCLPLFQLLGRLPSLRKLQFILTTSDMSGVEEWIEQLTSLEELYVDNSDMPVPRWGDFLASFYRAVSKLPSLKKLTLLGFHIDNLPKSLFPPSLKELHIRDCTKVLESRLQRGQGDDWPNVAWIPFIRINDRTVQCYDMEN